jgi:hypothetical protein
MFVSFLKKRIQVIETTSLIQDQKNFVVLQYDYLNLRDFGKIKDLFNTFSFRFIKKKTFSKFFSDVFFDFFFQSRFILCSSISSQPDLLIGMYKIFRDQASSFRFVCLYWHRFFFNGCLLDFCLDRGFFSFIFYVQFCFIFFSNLLMFRIFNLFNLSLFIK